MRRFSQLNQLEHLKVCRVSSEPRCFDVGLNDAITELLAQCQSPAELAMMAHRFGIEADEIYAKASRASGFGQFRMVLGRRVRGVAKRIDKARRSGLKWTLQKAAYPRGRKVDKEWMLCQGQGQG